MVRVPLAKETYGDVNLPDGRLGHEHPAHSPAIARKDLQNPRGNYATSTSTSMSMSHDHKFGMSRAHARVIEHMNEAEGTDVPPAPTAISASSRTVMGASSLGFTMTEFPAASAGAIFLTAMRSGWLKG